MLLGIFTVRLIKKDLKKSKGGKEYLSVLLVDCTKKDAVPFGAICTKEGLVDFINDRITAKEILNVTADIVPREYEGKIMPPSIIVKNVDVVKWGPKDKSEQAGGSVLSDEDFDVDFGTLDEASEEAVREILKGTDRKPAKPSKPAKQEKLSALDEAMATFNSL